MSFLELFKQGVEQFHGLYELMMRVDESDNPYAQDELAPEMKDFGAVLLENPEAFSLWMRALFILADSETEVAVYQRCRAVFRVWEALQSQSNQQVWLPFETPPANNQQFRYLNRKF